MMPGWDDRDELRPLDPAMEADVLRARIAELEGQLREARGPDWSGIASRVSSLGQAVAARDVAEVEVWWRQIGAELDLCAPMPTPPRAVDSVPVPPGYYDHGEHWHADVALQDVGLCAACDAWWLAAAQAPAPPLTTAEMAEDAAVKRGDVVGDPEPIVPDLAPEPSIDDPRRPGVR